MRNTTTVTKNAQESQKTSHEISDTNIAKKAHYTDRNKGSQHEVWNGEHSQNKNNRRATWLSSLASSRKIPILKVLAILKAQSTLHVAKKK
jgi:hypothetical protein